MSFKRRAIFAALLATGLAIGTANIAEASYGPYTISARGVFSYITSSNHLNMNDLENGHYLYTRYKFTNTPCSAPQSDADACEPSNWSTLRNNSSNIHNEQHTLNAGTYDYVLLKFCQDDTPPDTCSDWKWSAA